MLNLNGVRVRVSPLLPLTPAEAKCVLWGFSRKTTLMTNGSGQVTAVITDRTIFCTQQIKDQLNVNQTN